MQISLITVCYNSAATLEACIQSVEQQGYPELDYIIIDGGSNDGTVEIIRRYAAEGVVSQWVSEPDQGIYDAMNKGLAMAKGAVIGFLNADDRLAPLKAWPEIRGVHPPPQSPTVLGMVAEVMQQPSMDALYGDVAFIRNGELVRHYSSAGFHPGKFARGYMPAHLSFYAKRELYQKAGMFRTDFKIAADFDLLLRMMHVHRAKTVYVPATMVYMSPGGISNASWKSRVLLNREIVKSCREHGLPTSTWKVYLKYFKKIREYFPGRKDLN
jgi:glycosyltransferase involved in cell wall biosynthesis